MPSKSLASETSLGVPPRRPHFSTHVFHPARNRSYHENEGEGQERLKLQTDKDRAQLQVD